MRLSVVVLGLQALKCCCRCCLLLSGQQEAPVRIFHRKLSGMEAVELIYSACMHAKSVQLCQTLCYPLCSLSGSSVMGFSRQEYWSGLPCPPPRGPGGGLLHLLHWQAGSLPLAPPGKPDLFCPGGELFPSYLFVMFNNVLC